MTALFRTLQRLSIALLLALLGTQVSSAQATGFVISGRVVDWKDQPVANAVVSLHPLSRSGDTTKSVDDLVAEYGTDAGGRFSIPSSLASVGQAILYVTTPVAGNAFAPLRPPFLDSRGARLLAGKPITINQNVDVDVGDIPISARFRNVTLVLRNSSGKPSLARGDEPPWFKVNDAHGDMVALGAVPEKAVGKDDSSITLALPEGLWTVAVSLTDKDGPWYAVDKPLDLRESQVTDPRVLLKLTGQNEDKPRFANQTTSKLADPEKAQRRLTQLGISYSESSFIEHAGTCNAEAVQLFLGIGMNPDVKDKGGTTPLLAAASRGCGDIVEALLDHGANPSLANERMTTALCAASSSGSLVAVTALLRKHADPNTKDDEGLTPLIIASGNSHLEILKALLAARADVNLKDRKGMTALDYAVQTGDQEIIGQLKLSGAKTGTP